MSWQSRFVFALRARLTAWTAGTSISLLSISVMPMRPAQIRHAFFIGTCLVNYAIYGLWLIWNGLLMLGDGFQYYLCHFKNFQKCSPNLDPWTPYLLQKYCNKYKNIPNHLKQILFFKSEDLIGSQISFLGKYMHQEFGKCGIPNLGIFKFCSFWCLLLGLRNIKLSKMWTFGRLCSKRCTSKSWNFENLKTLKLSHIETWPS